MSARLRALLVSEHPESAAICATDPQQALQLIPNLSVVWTHGRPRGACAVGAVYNGDSDPPTITLAWSSNERRNNFTALHEMGHHLLYNDEDWAFRVLPSLGDRARFVEEDIANDFAAQLLLPDAVVKRHLGAGVTATGIRQLILGTEASATACCSRALSLPGQRLVLLSSIEGRIWHAASNGYPLNPGQKVHQPALVAAAGAALDLGGAHTLVGGEGIRYNSGYADTDVQIDAVIHDSLVIGVVTSTLPDSRLRLSAEWNDACAACGEHFQVASSSGRCSDCGDWRCPRCRGCECSNSKAVVCTRCWTSLSVVEVSKGLRVHEDC